MSLYTICTAKQILFSYTLFSKIYIEYLLLQTSDSCRLYKKFSGFSFRRIKPHTNLMFSSNKSTRALPSKKEVVKFEKSIN